MGMGVVAAVGAASAATASRASLIARATRSARRLFSTSCASRADGEGGGASRGFGATAAIAFLLDRTAGGKFIDKDFRNEGSESDGRGATITALSRWARHLTWEAGSVGWMPSSRRTTSSNNERSSRFVAGDRGVGFSPVLLLPDECGGEYGGGYGGGGAVVKAGCVNSRRCERLRRRCRRWVSSDVGRDRGYIFWHGAPKSKVSESKVSKSKVKQLHTL